MEEQQDFLADGLEDLDADGDDLQLHTSSIFKADHVDAFDSDCDEAPNASAIFIARLSFACSINGDIVGPTYDSDILFEVPHYDTYHETDMLNHVVQEMEHSEHLVHNNDSYDELTSDINVISYVEYMVTIDTDATQSVSPLAQDNVMIFSVKNHLDEFDVWIKDRTVISGIHYGNWGGLYKEVNEMKTIFKQMEDEVDQCSVEKKYFEIEKKQLPINNDRLLEDNISCDVMCSFLHSSNRVDNCEHCISLELSLQHNKEKMIYDESWKIHDASLITEINNKYFEINDLKAQLQEKSIVVNEFRKLDDENMSLAFKISSLVLRMRFLSHEQITRIRRLCNIPLRKRTGIKSRRRRQNPNVIASLNLLRVSLRRLRSDAVTQLLTSSLNNRAVHRDYLKVNKEHIETLQELLKQARTVKPLDENLDYASKFAKRIQDLLVSDEEPSDVGSLGVIVYGYDGLLMHPVAPPSSDYASGPEHLPSPDYVPGPENPPSLPLPDDASPTALSWGYVADSNPEEDPGEDHADYPADGGDGDDESSDNDDDDDADDKDEEASEDEDDDKEEEEHLAPADSSVVPVVDPVPSAGDTEAFETDESAPTPPSPKSSQIVVPLSQTRLQVARLLALPTPPPSPLTPLSSLLPQIPSPPLPVSSPPLLLPSPPNTSPTYVEAPLGYRATKIRMRAASPPLLLPFTSHRIDIPEAEMSPQKRACFTTPASRFEVEESSAATAAR
ncbi:hypothetical protein Tco_1012488 [Tanacetum coccineum]